MLLNPEMLINERADVFQVDGRHQESTGRWAEVISPLRDRRTGHVLKGLLGTWEPLSSPSEIGFGRQPDRNLSRPLVAALGHQGSELMSARRYRQAKETKCGGMGGRESENFIVPPKRGNCPDGPRGGKEVPDHGTVGGQDARDTELRDHLNETAADSESVECLYRRCFDDGCATEARWTFVVDG